MGETKKQKAKGSGRKKGTRNKRSWDCVRILERAGFSPAAKLVQYTLDAEEDYKKHRRLSPEDASRALGIASTNAAKLMKFVHPELKAVDVTSGGKEIKTLSALFAAVLSEPSDDSSDPK